MRRDLIKSEIHDEMLCVRLTPTEMKTIHRLARKNKMSVSEFVRMVLFPTDVPELKKYMEED